MNLLIVKNLFELIPISIKKIIFRSIRETSLDAYGIRIWRKVLIETATNNNFLNYNFIKMFAHSRTSSRLFYNTFHNENKLTLKNIILFIAMESIDSNVHIPEKNIILLASAIQNRWNKEIKDNDLLAQQFKGIYDEKNEKTVEVINSEIEEYLLKIIKNKKQLRKEFFESYSNTNLYSAEIIRVYLPNDEGYISWAEEYSVDVKLNSYEDIELGFFRQGYDYKLVGKNSNAWSVAISKNKKSEAVQFGNSTLGKQSSKYIWIR